MNKAAKILQVSQVYPFQHLFINCLGEDGKSSFFNEQKDRQARIYCFSCFCLSAFSICASFFSC